MTCCEKAGGYGKSPVVVPPPYYNVVKTFCGLAIIILAVNARPKRFATSAALGFAAQWIIPQLTSDITNSAEACASGCTDIVAESLNLGVDPRISLIIATVLFSDHIGHHAKVMVPIAGALCGARIFHTIKSENKRYNESSSLWTYFEVVSEGLNNYFFCVN